MSAVSRWKKLDPPVNNARSKVSNRRPHARFSSSPLEGERGEPNRTKNGRDGAQRACGAEDGRGVNPGSPEAAAQSRRGAEKGDPAERLRYVRRILSVELRRAARGAEAPQEQSERDRPLLKVGSSPKHARADVAGRDRDRQCDKWSVLNKEIERTRRAFAFGSRLLAEASDTLFNPAGGVLNRVRRYAFHVLNQARDVALHRVKILAK